jgi:putative flippase GtrA
MKDGVFVKFFVIGALGFCVDAGILFVLIAGGGGIYSSRLVSFPAAVTATWYLNRIWSFSRTATDRPIREYVNYIGVQTVATTANFLVYAALLRFIFNQEEKAAIPALAAGAGVGLIINYLGARIFVFVGLPKKRRLHGIKMRFNDDRS